MSGNPSNIFGETFEARLAEIVEAAVKRANESGQPSKRLYNSKEAAIILNVPKPWVEARGRAGEIKVTRLGAYVLFAIEDIEEFVQRMRELPPTPKIKKTRKKREHDPAS